MKKSRTVDIHNAVVCSSETIGLKGFRKSLRNVKL